MKYLKLFNESLSQEDRNEISQYCKDIFLDLKDDGITITTSWSVNFKWIIIEFYRVGRDFSVSQYKDELRMLSSYLKSLGFVFNGQQKYSPKNKLGYYNSQMLFRFTFSYRLDDELNESVYGINYDKNTDEEILEIKSVFMDIIDEFDLEQYRGQDICDDNLMNFGIYYDIERSYYYENIIEIYLYLIDSRCDGDPNYERLLKIIEQLKFFKKRLYDMGFNCTYPVVDDIDDIIGAEDFITIQIESINPIEESFDSLPKDIQDMIDNFPKSHRYRTERGEISMIHPCVISQNMYEIYCIEGNFFEDVERYSTLEEAESRIDELIGWF